MSALEKQIKMVQPDAFRTQEEIIAEKVKEKFEPRLNYLFARLGEINEQYKMLTEHAAFLYDEIEAAKDAFIATNVRMKNIEIQLENG